MGFRQQWPPAKHYMLTKTMMGLLCVDMLISTGPSLSSFPVHAPVKQYNAVSCKGEGLLSSETLLIKCAAWSSLLRPYPWVVSVDNLFSHAV